MNKSFTLIEILVVIVVIGVLSAFILVGMSSITNSANIAKGQAFINSMDNYLLLAKVSQWKLDERTTAGHGDTFIDSWGSNTGTLYTNNGTNNKVSSNCPLGKCLSFDGIDDYVDCGSDDSLDLGDGNTGTVGTWVKVSSWPSSGYPSIINKGNGSGWSAGSYHISIWSSKLRFVIWESSGTYNRINLSLPSENNWHYLLMTWGGIGQTLKAYVDGQYINQDNQTAKANIGVGQSLKIGRSVASATEYFNGLVDDVRIYNQAIPTSEIQQNYYIGLNKLYKNNGIALNEFNQRLVELKSNLAKI